MNIEWISDTLDSDSFFDDYISAARAIGYQVTEPDDSLGGFILVSNDIRFNRYRFRCFSTSPGKVEIQVLGLNVDAPALVKEVFDAVTKKWLSCCSSSTEGQLRVAIQSWP